MGAEKIELGPQPGPQTQFLSTTADIAIYGGAAGGGKSYALLLEPIRHYHTPGFGGVIFRRTSMQFRNEGGLWDQSMRIYPLLGAKSYESSLEWIFPFGSRIKFAHLEHEKNVLDWQGSEIPYIGFDELTHFTEKQFWYMLSRNRSTSGVIPYVRCTTNPDKKSWVRKLISWWIGKDGLAIESRSGKVRWFVRQNDSIIWGDSRKELVAIYGEESMPKSLTFIAAKLSDNQILMKKDPNYLANLNALPRVDRMRLKDGNWDVQEGAGNYFRREDFKIIDALPGGWIGVIRYWDKAATEPSPENPDPDWTRGLKLYKYPNGTYVVGDLKSCRSRPGGVETLVSTTASHDSNAVTICVEQDPGSAGKADAANFVKLLAGYDVRVCRPDKDKATRAKPVSAQSEAGNVMLLRAPWNDDFLDETENFTGDGKGHDDIVDTLSGAFNELCSKPSILDVL